MKKIIFLALVALLGIHTVDAQRRGGTRTPEQIVEKLDKKLNLTDEQEKQITELYTEFFKKASNPQLSSSASFLRLNVLSSLN